MRSMTATWIQTLSARPFASRNRSTIPSALTSPSATSSPFSFLCQHYGPKKDLVSY